MLNESFQDKQDNYKQILLSVLLLVGCSASQSASSEHAKAPQSPEPGQIGCAEANWVIEIDDTQQINLTAKD